MWPEDSGLLIDDVTEIVKHEINKQESGFFGTMIAPMGASLISTYGFFTDTMRFHHW